MFNSNFCFFPEPSYHNDTVTYYNNEYDYLYPKISYQKQYHRPIKPIELFIGTKEENLIGNLIISNINRWALMILDKEYFENMTNPCVCEEYFQIFYNNNYDNFSKYNIKLRENDLLVFYGRNNCKLIPNFMERYLKEFETFKELYSHCLSEMNKYLKILKEVSLKKIRQKKEELKILGCDFLKCSMKIYDNCELILSKLIPLNKKLKAIETRFDKVNEKIITKQSNIAKRFITSNNVVNKFINEFEIKTAKSLLKMEKKIIKLQNINQTINKKMDSKFQCGICLVNLCNSIALPCCHAKYCFNCLDKIFKTNSECSFCRQEIKEIKMIYF
jgi:hypothetical protein